MLKTTPQEIDKRLKVAEGGPNSALFLTRCAHDAKLAHHYREVLEAIKARMEGDHGENAKFHFPYGMVCDALESTQSR